MTSLLSRSQWVTVFIGASLGVVMGIVVTRESGLFVRWFPGVAWVTSVSEARSVLSGLVAVEVTALSIVMSLNLLALQNATGQYSPRLLQFYLKDPVLQTMLAILVWSGAYFVTTAVTLGLGPDSGPVPRPALSLALIVFIVAGAALGFQIYHTVQLIRVEILVHRISHLTIHTAGVVDTRSNWMGLCDSEELSLSPDAVPVPSARSGYVTWVDGKSLAETARRYNVSIRIEAVIGEAMVRGMPIGWVEGADLYQHVFDEINAAVDTSVWRDPHFDTALGFRQLVDIAIKALSPAINDPYTAVNAIDGLTYILVHLAGSRLGDRVICVDGHPRVLIRFPSLYDYLMLASEQISRYGAADPSVTLKLLEMVRDTGLAASEPAAKDAVLAVERMIVADCQRATDPKRFEAIRRVADEVEKWLKSGKTPGKPWPVNL